MIRIDEFTNVKELTGKNFVNTPYKLRTLLHEKLTDAELLAFRQNSGTSDFYMKVQALFNEWYKEEYPNSEVLHQRHLEAQRLGKIDSLNRELARNKERLSKLDKMAQRDEVLPVGERKRLKAEIERINSQLAVHNTVPTNEKANQIEDEWIEKVLL